MAQIVYNCVRLCQSFLVSCKYVYVCEEYYTEIVLTADTLFNCALQSCTTTADYT